MKTAQKYIIAAGMAGFIGLCVAALSTSGQSSDMTAETTSIAAAPTVIGGGTALNGDPGGFGIDGDLLANTPMANVSDWLDNSGGVGVGLLNSNGTAKDSTVTIQRLDGVNAADDVFAGSNKLNQDPNTWKWQTQAANDKTDMNNAYVHISNDSMGHRWITASGDRRSTNGTAYIDFELLQNTLTMTTRPSGCTSAPCGGFTSAGPNGGRTLGDLLLTAGYGSGGSVATFQAFQWQASGNGFAFVEITSMLPPSSAFVATNLVDGVSVPYGAFGGTTYIKNQFVEMSVDLTALLGALSDPCTGIQVKTVLIKTKTSTSTTATLMDFTVPVPISFSAGFVISATGQNPNCSGGTGSITATFSGGTGTYQCKLDSGSFAACTSPQTYTGLAAGAHSVTVQDSGGCTKTSNTVTITNPTPISASETTTPASCNGGSDGTVTVNVGGGTSPYSVTVNGVTHSGVTSSTTFMGLPSGTYPATISDAHSCPGSAAGVLVGEGSTISASETTTPASCNGGSDGSVTVNVSGGTSPYSVTVNGVTHSGVTGSTTFTGLPSGTYPATISDSKSCSGSAAGVLVGQPAAISASETTTPTSCNHGSDGTVTVNVSGGTSPYSVTVNGVTHSGVTSSTTFTGLPTGTYPATISDTHSCAGSAAGVLVAQPSAITASASGTNPACSDGTGTVTVTASGGTGTLMYSKDGTNFQSSNEFTGLAAGNYTITVKDANGCTATTNQVTIVTPPPLQLGVGEACTNGTEGSLTVTASGGTGTLTYSKDGTNFQSSNVFTGLTAGDYTITVKDANGCTRSDLKVHFDSCGINFCPSPGGVRKLTTKK
jgi:hypothetical protein